MNKNKTLERAAAQHEKCLGCKHFSPETADIGASDYLSEETQECQYRGATVFWPDMYICDDARFDPGDDVSWIMSGVQRSLTLTCVGYERRPE